MKTTPTRILALGFAALAVLSCSSDIILAPPPAAPKITSFTISAAVVPSGAPVTLSWATQDATEVRIVDGRGATLAGVDNKPTGTVNLNVTQSSLFVLEALNSRGVKVTALRSVAIEGAKVAVVFRAIPQTLLPGQSSTLAWTAPGAKVVTITPAGGTALALGGQLESGAVSVSPDAASTAYTLDADGVTQTVTVTRQAELLSFQATPDLGAPGDRVTLSWTTKYATKVTLSAPGRGTLKTVTDAAELAAGSFQDTLPSGLPGTALPYALAVEGLGLAAERSLTVYLGGQPVLLTATANKYALEGLTFPITWSTQQADVVRIKQGSTLLYQTLTAGQASSGSFVLPTPTAKTDYTVEAARSGYAPVATQTLSVEPVGAIAIASFTAAPATVARAGDPVTLTWSAPNARQLSISDESGFEVFSAVDAAAAGGTVQVYPAGPASTYTLRVTNTLEAVRTGTAAVTVTAPFTSTVVGGGRPLQGVPADLTWDIGGSAPPMQGLPFPDVTTIPNSTGFVDISTTGLKLNPGSQDDSTASATLGGFSSRLLGAPVGNSITVSTNGFFVFGTAASRGTVTSITDAALERNFVAPFWADLLLGAQSTIHVQVLNEAPERTLVVQWTKVRAKQAPGRELTFQARLTQTGILSFDYKTFDPTGITAAYGVKGATQSVATPLPAQGTELRLGAPRSAPLTLTLQDRAPVVGFIKVGTNYLRAALSPNPILVSDLVVSEVLYRPAAAIATTGEWFELTNASASAIQLEGFTVDFGGGQPLLTLAAATGTTLLPANGTLVFSQSPQGADNDGVATNYVYGIASTLADTTGTLTIASGAFNVSSTWNSASPNNGGLGISVVRDPGPLLFSTDTNPVARSAACQPSATQTFGAQVPLQRGTPGINSGCFAYLLSPIPPAYKDISAIGTPVFPGFVDDSVTTVTLSAPVPYFGAPGTTLSISSNGWVAFKSVTTSAAGNKTIPSSSTPFGLVALFWDDLQSNPAPGAHLFLKRFAANEDPQTPAPHTVVQWHRFELYDSPGDDLNFQLKIFDNGVLEYHFATMTEPGSSATTWLETANGLTALVINNERSLITSNSAFRFSPR